jgi:hypothetical protein
MLWSRRRLRGSISTNAAGVTTKSPKYRRSWAVTSRIEYDSMVDLKVHNADRSGSHFDTSREAFQAILWESLSLENPKPLPELQDEPLRDGCLMGTLGQLVHSSPTGSSVSSRLVAGLPSTIVKHLLAAQRVARISASVAKNIWLGCDEGVPAAVCWASTFLLRC